MSDRDCVQFATDRDLHDVRNDATSSVNLKRGAVMNRRPARPGSQGHEFAFLAGCLSCQRRPRIEAASAVELVTIVAELASHSRNACAAIVSNTGCTSSGDWLITRRMSLVAVCCSSASVRSALRASSSLNSRTFSIAMTA